MEPLQLAITLAKAAGAYQLAHFHDHHCVEMKGVVDPVTDVDRHCEQMIAEGIRTHFPEHDILAEEGHTGCAGGTWQWIVDPLDGTVNYMHHYPLFCVCIALRGPVGTEFGVIYEPNREELFIAVRGQGAHCNDRPMHVTSRSALMESVLATGFAYDRERGEMAINIPIFTSLLPHTRAIRRDGVAGVDLAYVACGRFDGFWEYYLKPWDIAAGALMVEESGGIVTSMDGGPFDPFGTEIVATNGSIHQALCVHIRAAGVAS